MLLTDYLRNFPFIAITRGLHPEEATECAEILFTAGFRIIETPLNSPKPYLSIRHIVDHLGDRAIVGAGTVTELKQVKQVMDAGGRVIVSPHCDPDIIRKTKEYGLISVPGVASPTEAMNALAAGADALKLFPAEIISPAAVKAMCAVLPPETALIPVGSINTNNWQQYMQAGAAGFGLGSSLYKKSISPGQLRERANKFKMSWQKNKQKLLG